MRGFIIRRHSGMAWMPTSDIPIIVPVPDVRRISFSDDVEIIVWGDSPGDVTFSSGVNSGVLFNGYITDSPVIGISSTQNDTVDSLRVHIDAHLEDDEALKSMLCSLNGSFSFVWIDRNTSDIVAVTDRKMSRPLWYGTSGSDFAIGTNPLAVATAIDTNEPDLGGLGSLLLYGGQIAPTHSTYRDVRALDSAELRHFGGNGSGRAISWFKFRHHPDYGKSRREWVDYITERIIGASHRIHAVSPRLLVFLSGGLDSRIACAAFCAAGAEPLTATMTDSENLELSISRKVASALGCRHETIIRDRYWYLDNLDSIMKETGGTNDWIHSHFSRAYTMLREREGANGIDAALLGNGLESLNKLIHRVDHDERHKWSAEEFARDFDMLYPAAYSPIDRESTLSVFTPAARRAVEEQMRENIMRRYLDIRDVSEESAIVMSHFVRWHAMPSLASLFNNIDLRSAGPERSIMLDTEMLDIISVLPARMRNRAGLEAAVINRLSPRVGRIIYSNTLLPPRFPETAHRFSRYIRPKIGAVRRFLHPSFRSSGSWSNLFYLYRSDPRWNRALSDVLLDEDLFPSEIFDHRVIREKWESLLRGDYRHWSDIGRLFLIGRIQSFRRIPALLEVE